MLSRAHAGDSEQAQQQDQRHGLDNHLQGGRDQGVDAPYIGGSTTGPSNGAAGL